MIEEILKETPPRISMPRKILLGVSGSIAAYKAAEIARRLIEDGFDVYAAMTPAATRFLGPMTLEAITGHPVARDPASLSPWTTESDTERSSEADSYDDYENRSNLSPPIPHTERTRGALALLVAPASADILAKLAHGFADDSVSLAALALGRSERLILAPAMNPRMWKHAAVRANVSLLKERGAVFVGPETGSTACGETGTGRMAEPEVIVERVWALTGRWTRTARAPRALLLAGPTREPIDAVRYISNGSSGRMARALARAALRAGWNLHVIAGPGAFPSPLNAVADLVEYVTTAEEMLNAARKALEDSFFDLLLSPAAIADFRPTAPVPDKPPKTERLTLELEPTPDVLSALTSSPRRPRLVVAFAAEAVSFRRAPVLDKGRRKNADWIVFNRIETIDAENVEAVLVDCHSGKSVSLPSLSKQRFADRLVAFLDKQLTQAR